MWNFPLYDIHSKIDWNKIESEYDWFQEMKDVPQDSIWHAEGDVYTHTKMVVEALISLPEYQSLSDQDKYILFTSALFHDIEKRSTTKIEDINGVARIVSPKHAKKGEFTTRKILYKDIITPFHIREQIAKLVRLHGLPIWAIEKNDPVKEVISASLIVNTAFLYILAKADMLGRICDDQKECLLKIELFKELCVENNCFGKDRMFTSNYGRYLYLNKPQSSPDYEPFDDLKFCVFVLSALPGTGKDTFIKNNFDIPVLSLDNIRRELKIEPTDKKGNGKTIQIGKERAKEYLRSKSSFVFNATNITYDMRNKWINLFIEYGGRVKIIYLEVPYHTLITQNRNRDYSVPDDVIEKMINKLEIPSYKEAHDIEYIIM